MENGVGTGVSVGGALGTAGIGVCGGGGLIAVAGGEISLPGAASG